MTNQGNHPKAVAAPSTGSTAAPQAGSSSISSGQDLRRKAEALAQERSAAPKVEDSATLSLDEIRETLDELRVHQIELEMQNEELRTAQDRIDAGRARYFDLYDLAPVGYCTLSEQGLVLEANLTAAALLGTARGALLKQPISRFICKEDQGTYYLHRKLLFDTGEAQECELRLVKPDGAVFWAHLTATAAHAEDGAPVCRAVISDVSERKWAEEYLLNFKQIVSSTADGIALLDTQYRYVIVNKAYEMFSGKTQEGLVGLTVSEYLGEAIFAEHIKAHFDQCLEGRTVRFQDWFDYPTLGRRFVEVSYFPYVDARGDISGIVANTRDITERKQSEDALRSSRQLLAATEALSAVGGWEWDVAGQVMAWTDGTYRIHDLDAVAVPAGSPEHIERSLACYDQGERPRVEEAFRRCVEAGEPYDLECGFTTAKGRRLCVRTVGRAIRENGRTVKVIGNIQDISERKRAEAAQREVSGRMAAVYEGARDAIFIADVATGVILDANVAAACLVNRPLASLVGLHQSQLHPPEHAERYRQQFSRRAAQTAPGHAEGEAWTSDGRRIPVEISASTILLAGGQAAMVGIFRDITERKQAEEALQSEHQRLQSVVDGSRLGTWVWNVQTSETVFNETWAGMLGYTLSELMPYSYATWERLVHPDDLTTAKERLRRCAAGETPEYECEFRMRHKDGRWVWILDRGRVMARDAGGAPLSMFGTHTDITEIKRVEEARHESEARFRNYIERSPYGVFVVDGQGHYVDVNPAAVRISGYSAAQLTSMRIADLLPPESREAGLEHFQTLVETGESVGESAFRRADGSIGQWMVSATRLGPDSYLGFVEDITERTEREARMALLGHMLDEAPAAVTIHDTTGRFIFSNRQNALLHGYDSAEGFLSVNLHDLDMPESEALLAERFQQIAEKGELRFEVAHHRKDGSTLPLDVTARAIGWQGQPAVLSIAMDITERKRAAEERERLQAQFLQAQKMESVGRLAGGVAHDFNNLLMGIMNYTELCRDRIEPDHPIREWLDEITREAERSAKLTRQLLAFARRQTIMPQFLDLNDAVSGMLKLLRRLIGEDISLAWMPGMDIWPIKVDPGQIDQILANLCVNARDAIGGVGRLTLETATAVVDGTYCADHVEAAPGEYAMLAVSDDGCGMDREILAHVFEPFFTTKGVGQGTGLGLATVHGIVKQNGGFVNVYSEPGMGTTFRIYFPRCQVAAEARAVPQAPATIPGGTETIMLVEDEKSIRVTTAMFLGLQGYTVLTAADPGEALRLAERHPGPIHLLITDVVMPGMNGRDLAGKLAEEYPRMKCLFISGYTANVIAHRGIVEEGVHFLAKPFSRDAIARRVYEVLRGEQTTGKE